MPEITRTTPTVGDTVATRLAAARPPSGAFIGGRSRPSEDGRSFGVHSPLMDAELLRLPRCGRSDVEQAASHAQSAFAAGRWSRAEPAERKRAMLRLADAIELQGERFALLETIETGRPLREARSLDVAKSVERLRWYAELADKVVGEIAPSPPDRLALVTREPIGVVAAIVPWNFPLLMAITKVAPALAAGNVAILKPAETSSLTALALAELAAGLLPENTLQVVTGLGAECGQALGECRQVDALAFTGSTATGASILATGACSLKRISLECGGKSPHIVLDSSVVDERMIDEIVWGVCYNQGQVCDAGANLILVGGIDRYDRLLAGVAARMSALTIGDPFDDTIDLGSMISASHLAKVSGFVERAEQAGANVSTGGRSPPAPGGAFFRPTLLTNVAPSSEVFTEEVFGPVLAVTNVPDADAAIALVNGARYGLAAAVWGSDQRLAMQVAATLRVGVVAVNTFELGTIATPFGGFRESGLGRDRSAHALANYTELKTSWIRTS